MRRRPIICSAALLLSPLVLGLSATGRRPADVPCDPNNGGLLLPEGSCATLVASGIGAVRQLAVAPNGDLYAAIAAGGPGGVLVLRDRDGDGNPDERASFAPTGANDVEIYDGYAYVALNDRILRYKLSPPRLEPTGESETVVSELPSGGNHAVKSLAFGEGGIMYVTIGSASNSCQQFGWPGRLRGKNPCPELRRRAGIWRFSARRVGQRFQDGQRFATGLRNALALATQPRTGELFAAVNGRDNLADWGFSDEFNANNPAEELVHVRGGDDFGWPYCYYSNAQKRKVLAPEYGGDGKEVGRCAATEGPVLAFPGHWAPLALAFYDADRFGPTYKGGLFVAFHGSWNRAPLPQAGYRVVFVPFANGRPAGGYSTFAISKAGPTDLRASGLAVGKDGSLYIAADDNQKIWRVTRKTLTNAVAAPSRLP